LVLGLRLLLVAAAASAALSLSQGARGQEQNLPGVPSVDEQEQQGVPRPYAPDERSGHVIIRAVSGLLLPAGFVRSEAALADAGSFGVAAGGTLGVGISRHAELDATGIFGLMAPPSECDSCASTTASASLGVRYHLAQGVSFDPWIRLGVGYRTAEILREGEATLRLPTPGRYHGVDFTQISVGASFSPVSGFGFGPYLEADVGTFVSRPDPDPGGGRVYAYFQIGLSAEIDPVRWFEPAPAVRSATPPTGRPFSRPGASL
jgi:hypothetical protein